MKLSLRLLILPFMLLVTHPAQSALVGADNFPSATTPPPPPAQPSNSPKNETPSQSFQNQLPKDLSKVTPDQAKALMDQASKMSPEQLQAIAKSYQQQPSSPGSAGSSNQATDSATPTSGADAQFVPKPKERSLEELQREEAFKTLINEVLPLSPEQIVKIHKYYDATLQAKATPPHAPPIPHFTSIVVNLEPGSQPPVIRLAAGFVTSMIFVDSTGAPWPLTAYSIGDPQNFNIQWDSKGNALFVQSLKPYAHGNLAVRLWGLNTPVMITLVSGQKNVDFRVDLQVHGRGPDAKPPVVDTTLNAKVNPILINILDGIPPRGSVKLGVSGGQGEAWYADERVYFRTKLTVLSPAWTATVASPDGTHVYELTPTPYILASQNGKTVDIKLSGL